MALYEGMRFIRLSEAAALLGVHPDTLWRWEKRGEGPPGYAYPGGQTAYVEEEVIAWREAQRKPPPNGVYSSRPPQTRREIEAAAYFDSMRGPTVPLVTCRLTKEEYEHIEAMRNGTAQDETAQVLAEARKLTNGKADK